MRLLFVALILLLQLFEETLNRLLFCQYLLFFVVKVGERSDACRLGSIGRLTLVANLSACAAGVVVSSDGRSVAALSCDAFIGQHRIVVSKWVAIFRQYLLLPRSVG
jgi:hypothetical protein